MDGWLRCERVWRGLAGLQGRKMDKKEAEERHKRINSYEASDKRRTEMPSTSHTSLAADFRPRGEHISALLAICRGVLACFCSACCASIASIFYLSTFVLPFIGSINTCGASGSGLNNGCITHIAYFYFSPAPTPPGAGCNNKPRD